MQFFNGANKLERIRRRRVASGELIDVTNEALHHGIADTVCISKRLWTSLIQPFPFAETGDCLSLLALLGILKRHLSASRAHAFLLLPSLVPEWCGDRCFVKVLVNSPAGGPRSIILQPFSDPLPVFAQRLDDSLPASLLVRLAETLRRLVFISRASDLSILKSMQTVADQLIRSNPFHLEITAHVITSVSPETSLPFPLDDYRLLLLADLDEILAILGHCADVKAKPKVDALQSPYRALLSPLAAFGRILEDLLRFTVSGSDPQAPFQHQAFALLLNLHAQIITRLNRLETQVPPDALAVVRFQIRLLASAVGLPNSQFLADIESACASLASNRLSHATPGPSGECRHAVVWH